jgi:Methyltransferase domain
MPTVYDIYRPFQSYFRAKRMRELWRDFDLSAQTRVLGVGGGLFNWGLVPTLPQLTIINIALENERDAPASWLIAQGQYLPFQDGAFDLVYSNSVIEHLHTLENQSLFAAECRRVGRRYYVQTPDRLFPIEPHYLAPFIHWLPRGWQRRLIRNFTLRGLLSRPSPQECDALVDEIRLLDEAGVRSLFPDAAIRHERLLGFSKSLIAVGRNPHH